MSWHVRDCGVKAIATVTGRPVDDVKSELVGLYGGFQLNGSQMRRYLRHRLGWSWTHTVDPTDLPQRGSVIVVTRRGFYALTDGVANMRIYAPQCGYYLPPVNTSL